MLRPRSLVMLPSCSTWSAAARTRSSATIRRIWPCRWASGWAARRATWPPKSSRGSTSPTSASRPRSPGRASSICGCATSGSSSGCTAAVGDPRLGVAAGRRGRGRSSSTTPPPNVAKPMHVGHIRSTVIGDASAARCGSSAIAVISDNHIGDWGTQFGMIIYGYEHFVDAAAYRRNPVEELARLYRLVRQLVDYHEGRRKLPKLREQVAGAESSLAELRRRQSAATPTREQSRTRKSTPPTSAAGKATLAEMKADLAELEAKLAAVDGDPQLAKLARRARHDRRGRAGRNGQAARRRRRRTCRLWQRVPAALPGARSSGSTGGWACTFDHTLGESFYHDRLAAVVEELAANAASPGRATARSASSSKARTCR